MLGKRPPVEIIDSIEFNYIPLYKDRDFLHRKYTVERLSCADIATQIVSSRTVVLKHLRAFGIPVREIGQNVHRRRGIAYGRQIKEGEERANRRELEAIERMHSLRERGFSYWKIADILNSMKVPTKTHKGRWYARTVLGVLENVSSA